MGNLLNFSSDRERSFDSARPVEFDPNRDLTFDSDRDLTFDSTRDLPFGKRGVVFRGLICPVCGAQVTETQETCTECGATFTTSPDASTPRTVESAAPSPAARQQKRDRGQRLKASSPRTPPAPSPLPAPTAARWTPPPAPVTASAPPQPSGSGMPGTCSRCGARVLTSDTFCWACGARFSPTETVPLGPSHQVQSNGTTKEWSETDWRDFR